MARWVMETISYELYVYESVDYKSLTNDISRKRTEKQCRTKMVNIPKYNILIQYNNMNNRIYWLHLFLDSLLMGKDKSKKFFTKIPFLTCVGSWVAIPLHCPCLLQRRMQVTKTEMPSIVSLVTKLPWRSRIFRKTLALLATCKKGPNSSRQKRPTGTTRRRKDAILSCRQLVIKCKRLNAFKHLWVIWKSMTF